MRTSIHVHSATRLHAYERGGLTTTAEPGATPIARFAYSEHCDIEVPVDSDGQCTHCFHDVLEDEDE